MTEKQRAFTSPHLIPLNNDYETINQMNNSFISNNQVPHYLTNNLNQSNTNKPSKIKINHLNCNSIKNKLLEFKNYLENFKPDIFSLNEIKCSDNWANELLYFDNYNTTYKCRDNYGGGVGILTRDHIDFTENDISLRFSDEEIVGITCKIDSLYISFSAFTTHRQIEKTTTNQTMNY